MPFVFTIEDVAIILLRLLANQNLTNDTEDAFTEMDNQYCICRRGLCFVQAYCGIRHSTFGCVSF